jgi:hypothetical protein
MVGSAVVGAIMESLIQAKEATIGTCCTAGNYGHLKFLFEFVIILEDAGYIWIVVESSSVDL